MYNFGLSTAQRKAYEALLQSSHTIEVRLTIMDLDHAEQTDVSARLMDGQVTYDAEASITRLLSLDLLDPNGALHLDSKSPDDGAMFIDRMIRVRYTVRDPIGTVRYTCPIFTGPITKLERNGVAVRVEASGKEIFGLGTPWMTKTYKKGYTTTSVIRSILSDIIGENKIDVPDRSYKLPRNVSVGTTTDKDGNRTESKSPWEVAKSLAKSIGFQLYYDGNGVASMRKMPESTVFTFTSGDGGCVKTVPSVGFNIDAVINAVEVFGKKPEKPKKGHTAKKQPHARIAAPRAHPLSPWALGRSGGPRYLPVVIDDDGITTDVEATARAKAELARGLRSSLDVAYDSLVIPHLEELDVVRVHTDKFAGHHTLKRFTIPLTAAGVSSIGYVKNVKVNASALKALQRKRRKAAR